MPNGWAGRQRKPRRREPAGAKLRTLLQRRVDVGKLSIQICAEAVDDSDDGERDAGSDQAVLNSGGAGLVRPKLRNKTFHVMPIL